jgi:protein phosphatase
MGSLQLNLALGTHRGRVRERNEDAVIYHYPSSIETLNSYGALFAVADGVGGLANGAEVADYALRRLIEIYYHEPLSDPSEMLKNSIIQVNAEIYREYHTKSATTLVAMLVRQEEAIVAHVGDSRAYHGRPNMLKLITQDHAAEMVDANGKSRRKLTRALGYRAHVEVSIATHAIQKDDCFLLITDGASRYFDTIGLYKLLSESPRDSVQRIIQRSIEEGGMDNVSAIMLQVGTALSSESALSTHLRQLAQIGVKVELPDNKDLPKTNSLQPLLLWFILFFGIITAGAAFYIVAPRFLNSESATIGQQISFDVSAQAFIEASQETSAILLEPHHPYIIQDILLLEETWICLYDAENERTAWIREADMPAYRLLN